VISFPEFPPIVFLLGFDSLLGGLAIGATLSSWRERTVFVLLFGVCDGTATVLGAAGPHIVPNPPAVVLYLLIVVLIAQGVRRSNWWLYAIPVLCSLDNFCHREWCLERRDAWAEQRSDGRLGS